VIRLQSAFHLRGDGGAIHFALQGALAATTLGAPLGLLRAVPPTPAIAR
jgi:hypothetical protein